MQVYYIVLAVVALLALTIFIFYDYVLDLIIGIQGNYRFTKMIKKMARKNDYLVVSDILVRLSEQEFGYIRHLLIADKYIYVIMGKTMSGAITGVGEDEKWIHLDTQRQHISNPIKENRRLLKALAHQLNLPENDFVNIVVFAKSAIVDDIALNNPLEAVLEENDFYHYIRMMEKTSSINDMDPQYAEILVDKIQKLNAYNLKIRNNLTSGDMHGVT
ncbi:TPA: NERD domain-containing protein [bacterium]|jgi:hypothetical protein|nr:NERD domain-containing protein [bacterium]